MGKNTPDAPDYTSAAQATAASNRQSTYSQTAANRPNQNTPFGSTSWTSEDQFDQAGYDRALQDWQAQGSRLGKNANDPEYLKLMPQRNDYYSQNWTQNTTLDPELQHALDSQMQMQSGRSDLANSLFPRAQQEFGQEMDWGNLNPMSFGPGGPAQYGAMPQGEQYQRNLDTSGLPDIDPSQKYYDKAGDAIFNQWSARNDPQMQRASEQLDTRLRNQGLKPGDQAYDQAVRDLQDQQSYARNDASMSATIGAGNEASRMQGMDLGARGQLFGETATGGAFANDAATRAFQQSLGLGEFGDTRSNNQFSQNLQSANFGNNARMQQIAEAMQKRGFSLNEINALISGQQVNMPQFSGFNAAGNSGGTDYSGAAKDQYQSALDAFNAKQSAISGMMSGVSNLGGTAMMFSDRRLKTNIRKIGEDPRGFNYYRWNWKTGGSGVGVMADEVAHLGIVHRHESGYDMVNYAAL